MWALVFLTLDIEDQNHQMKMYKETVLLLLFLGYVSTQEVSTPHSNASKPYEQPVTKEITTVATASIAKDEHLTTQTHSEISTQAPGKDGSRDRVTHALSGPVIAVVVFATIAGIVGVILFASFLVRRLTRKN